MAIIFMCSALIFVGKIFLWVFCYMLLLPLAGLLGRLCRLLSRKGRR